jgi:hypothetical protein
LILRIRDAGFFDIEDSVSIIDTIEPDILIPFVIQVVGDFAYLISSPASLITFDIGRVVVINILQNMS